MIQKKDIEILDRFLAILKRNKEITVKDYEDITIDWFKEEQEISLKDAEISQNSIDSEKKYEEYNRLLNVFQSKNLGIINLKYREIRNLYDLRTNTTQSYPVKDNGYDFHLEILPSAYSIGSFTELYEEEQENKMYKDAILENSRDANTKSGTANKIAITSIIVSSFLVIIGLVITTQINYENKILIHKVESLESTVKQQNKRILKLEKGNKR